MKDLKQGSLATVINASEETWLQFAEIPDVSRRWLWTSMLHILEIFSRDCHSPKTTGLRGTVMFAM